MDQNSLFYTVREKGRYQTWHKVKFYTAVCSRTWAWIFTILQNFLWTTFWLRTSSETFSWRFPIPEGKKSKPKNQSKQKTRTNPSINLISTGQEKRAAVGEPVRKTVAYKSLSLYTCSFSQRQKGGNYLMYMSRSENQASVWAKVTNTV